MLISFGLDGITVTGARMVFHLLVFCIYSWYLNDHGFFIVHVGAKREGLTNYTVSETDVVKKITPRDIQMEGRSLIYIFDGKI